METAITDNEVTELWNENKKLRSTLGWVLDKLESHYSSLPGIPNIVRDAKQRAYANETN